MEQEEQQNENNLFQEIFQRFGQEQNQQQQPQEYQKEQRLNSFSNEQTYTIQNLCEHLEPCCLLTDCKKLSTYVLVRTDGLEMEQLNKNMGNEWVITKTNEKGVFIISRKQMKRFFIKHAAKQSRIDFYDEGLFTRWFHLIGCVWYKYNVPVDSPEVYNGYLFNKFEGKDLKNNELVDQGVDQDVDQQQMLKKIWDMVLKNNNMIQELQRDVNQIIQKDSRNTVTPTKQTINNNQYKSSSKKQLEKNWVPTGIYKVKMNE